MLTDFGKQPWNAMENDHLLKSTLGIMGFLMVNLWKKRPLWDSMGFLNGIPQCLYL
jgi:hypothetical protein